MGLEKEKQQEDLDLIFSGSVYLLHAFDFGDDVNISKLRTSRLVHVIPHIWQKCFKSLHTPLTIEVPSVSGGPKSIRANIHPYGALSLLYKHPFKGTLQTLRKKLNSIDAQYQEQAVEDAHGLFRTIKRHIVKPKFFHHRNSYLVIHLDPASSSIDNVQLKKRFGQILASALRFETQNISEHQLNDILDSSTGYYREDLVIIDTETAFVFDKEPEELLDFFELGLLQKLELNYFDKMLEQKLDLVYNQAHQRLPVKSCLPFIGTLYDPIGELSKIKVDISVITERLENSIRLAGEPYFSEIYNLLMNKMSIAETRESVEKKLEIIKDVRTIYQSKIDSIREDLLSVLIIILIVIELLVALFK